MPPLRPKQSAPLVVAKSSDAKSTKPATKPAAALSAKSTKAISSFSTSGPVPSTAASENKASKHLMRRSKVPLLHERMERSIELGGPAAEQVFATEELRLRIFSYLDRCALANTMRLEKDVMQSVAGILYRRVTEAQVVEMDRETVRLSCSSVTREDTL